jgi:hypothetical protein
VARLEVEINFHLHRVSAPRLDVRRDGGFTPHAAAREGPLANGVASAFSFSSSREPWFGRLASERYRH